MSTRFQMTNMRDRKSNQQQPQFTTGNIFTSQENTELKLSMPEQQAPVYQPSSSTGVQFQSRTATRLFKGKFERGASQEQKLQSTATSEKPTVFEHKNYGVEQSEEAKRYNPQQSNGFGTSINGGFGLKNTVPQPSQEGLKLFLPDELDYTQEKEKKLTTLLKLTEPPKPATNKRILIEKKEEPKKQIIEEKRVEQKKVSPEKVKQVTKKPLQESIEQVPIAKLPQQNIPEEDEIQNQNQLVKCPEGCGRKFNKKALQSHAKACKLVFMSKRKEFNSEAKRVTSKQQANLVKQVKQKQKRQTQTKLEKTGEAWKTQSEGFRAVIKAIKAEEKLQEGDQEKQIGVVTCQYCEKKFSEILISKHIPICQVKREKEKKTTKKATKK